MKKLTSTVIGILGIILSINFLLNYFKEKSIHSLIGTILIGIISILILIIEYTPKTYNKQVKIIKHKK